MKRLGRKRTNLFVIKMVFMSLLAISPAAFAQSAGDEGGYGPANYPIPTPLVDWQQKAAPALALQALSSGLMGDKIDPHMGSIQFEHVDVALPGNSGLAVEIRRSIAQDALYHETVKAEFGDWELMVPRVSAIVAKDAQFRQAGQCLRGHSSNFQSVAVYYKYYKEIWGFGGNIPITIRSSTSTAAYEYSDGLKLYAPGYGSMDVLEAPTTAQAGPDYAFQNSKYVTQNNWKINCLSNGSGYVATGPDGTTVTLDKVYEHRAKDLVFDSEMEESFHRYKVVIAATRIEDIHGNYVDYTYDSQNRLTRIEANDGRVITLQYNSQDNMISAVTANGRQWSYAYRSNQSILTYWDTGLFPVGDYPTLSSVTRPDGLSWQFALDAMSAGPPPGRGCEGTFLMGVTHPYGTHGAFVLKNYKFRPSYDKLAFRGKWEGDYECVKPQDLGTNNPTINALTDYPYLQTIHKLSVFKKTLSGPNLPSNMVWAYNYEEDLGPPVVDPVNLAATAGDRTNYTEITQPDGTVEAYYHRWGTESHDGNQLVRQETRSNNTVVSATDFTHTWDNWIGHTAIEGNPLNSHAKWPRFLTKTRVEQDGDWYETDLEYGSDAYAPGFSFGQTTRQTSYSSVNPTPRVLEQDFEHNIGNWIVGLPTVTRWNGTEVVRRTYNVLGQKVTQSTFGQANDSIFQYHADGTPYRATDALGRITQATNWVRGTPQDLWRAFGTADKIHLQQVIDNNGWLTSATDAENNQTLFGYDTMGQLTSVDLPGSFFNSTNINYAYGASDFGGVLQTLTKGSATTKVHHDVMSRVRKTEQLTPGWSSISEAAYDNLGRVIYQSRPFTPGGTSDGVATTYDALGRVKRVEDTTAPYSIYTDYSYLSDNRVREDRPNGRYSIISRNGYSGPGQGAVIKIEEPGRTTDLDLNDFNKLLRLRQTDHTQSPAKTISQHFVYDAQQRLCAHHAPEHRENRYTYDAVGQVKTYAKGLNPRTAYWGTTSCAAPSGALLVTLDYDELGRVISKDFADPNTFDVENFYDDNSNLLQTRRSIIGAGMAGVVNELHRTYDELNNVLTENQQVDGAPSTLGLTYAYDANGFMNARLFPSNMQHVWTNNGFGQQQNLAQGGYSYASNITYHADGSLAGYTAGNGQAFTRTLDPLQRTQRLRSIGSGLTALDLTYAYNDSSQIGSILDGSTAGIGATGKTHAISNLQYDPLGQMTSADGWWGTGTFTPDGFGNLLTRALGTRVMNNAYHASKNRVTTTTDTLTPALGGTGTRSVNYDGRGNVTVTGGLSMIYDKSDQMIAMSGTNPQGAAISATFQYNGDGKRVYTNMNGRQSYPLYDAAGALRSVYKVHDGELVERISLQSGHPLAKWTGSTLTYLHADHLGTPIRGTHGLGAGTTPGTEVFQDFATPYGLNPTSGWHGNTGSGFDPATGPGSNCGVTGFTTHAKDCESGLTYMQARHYDPVLARFLSVDPVEFVETGAPGQFNRYAYTWNDPINANDPDGEFLNFVAKFVVDVGLEVAIQVASGQEIDLGSAAKGAAIGLIDPTKTARKVAKLGRLANSARKSRAASKAGAACPICFTAGTLVDTETGQRPIEEIRVGDNVWAWDEATGAIALKPVLHTVPLHERVIWDVVFISPDNQQIKIETTDEHPWWIIGFGWVETKDLKGGMTAKTRDGRSVSIDSITNTQRVEGTYNLSVANFETYFVGDYRVLVHNCPVGAYRNDHTQGPYIGKGDKKRAAESARRIKRETGDPLVSTKTYDAPTDRDSFKLESEMLDEVGGPKSSSNYNKIESPGKKYRLEDGDF